MTILFIIFTIISATIDAELYNSGYRFTDHTSRFLLRALVVVMHLMIATGTGSITLKAGSKMVMIAAGTLEDRD